LLFRPSSRCPVSSPSRLWTFRNCWCFSGTGGIAGAFLVLEECPVSASVDWALVMSLNTEIGVCPMFALCMFCSSGKWR
jgi:hypothetical protein